MNQSIFVINLNYSIQKIKMDNPNTDSNVTTPKEDAFQIGRNIFTTILQKNVNKQSLTQQDDDDESEFISEIIKIAHKKKADEGEHLFIQDTQISDETCDQIHEKAKFHAEASTYNNNSTISKNRIPPNLLCKCGCNRGKGEQLPFCQSETKHYFFGPGIILFFFYLKRILLLVFISSVIYGIFALSTNILSSDKDFSECLTNPGTLSFLCEYKLLSSVKNKTGNQTLVMIQLWLGFVFCFVWLISNRMIQSLGRTLNQKIDLYLDSSSDYCIQIDNLPFGDYTEGQILKHIIKLWKKDRKGQKQWPIVIKSVQIIYKMAQARELLDQIFDSSKELANIVDKVEEEKFIIKEQFKELYPSLKEKILTDLQKLEELKKKFIEDSSFRSQFATDMALIEFDESDQQTEFVKRLGVFRTTILSEIKQYLIDQCLPSEEGSNLFKERQLRIIRAPQPSDIHWNNCQKPFSYKRVGLVWLATLVIVGISFGMLMFIRFLRTQVEFLKEFSILISISLQIFNRVIWNALVKMIGFEQNNTKTDNIISIMSKSAVAQSINVLILPIISNVLLKDNLQGPEGLIGLSLDFQFTVLIMSLNLNLVNFPYLFKKIGLAIPCIRNCIIRSKIKPVGEIDTYQQIKDVLSYYEPPQFPIAGAYVYITTVIYQAFFFCYVQPTLLFYLCINITCFFLVQKYLLLRRCKIPELIDFLIFETCMSMMKNIPLLYGTGSLIFMYLLEQDPHFGYYVPSVLCIVMWFLYLLNTKKIFTFISKAIINCCWEEDFTKVSEEKIQNLDQHNESGHNFIKKMARNSFFDNQFSQRRECYYKKCNTHVLLNYESKLTEMKDEKCLDRNREFCERFNFNMQKKKNQNMIQELMQTKHQVEIKQKKKFLPMPIVKEVKKKSGHSEIKKKKL